MWDALLWVYLVNATLLITHEIDSAYWREWELFRMPGGIGLFLGLHLPLVLAVLYGLVLVATRSAMGLYFSLGLSLCGVGAFVIHVTFIKKGRPEFKTPMSLAILIATLLTSLVQAGLVIRVFVSPHYS